jgi:hypothetical protein
MNGEWVRMLNRSVREVLSQHLPEATEESHEKPQNSFVFCRDLNILYPKYKSGALPIEATCSVPALKNVNTKMCKSVILPVVLYGCET